MSNDKLDKKHLCPECGEPTHGIVFEVKGYTHKCSECSQDTTNCKLCDACIRRYNDHIEGR